jgi:hypothetical protein
MAARISCLLAALSTAAGSGELPPGQWLVSGDGEIFSVEANQASMMDLLADIQQMTPGEITLRPRTNRLISVRYTNIELPRLLARLGLDYSLQYRRDKTGDTLEEGWISIHDPSRAQPVFAFPPAAATATGAGAATGATAHPARKVAPVAPGALVSAETYRPPGAAARPRPRLDGSLSDWPSDMTWYTVGSLEQTGRVDLAYAFSSLSDGTNLTVAVEVRDDMKSVTNSLAGLPMQDDDSVLLSGPGLRDFTINRHHVLIAGPNGLQPAPQQYVSQSGGSKAVVHDLPDGWIVEITLPTKTNEFVLSVIDRDADEP